MSVSFFLISIFQALIKYLLVNTISRRIQSCFEQPKKDAPILYCNFSVSPNAPLRKEDRGMASHRLGISKVKEWFSMRRISMTYCSMPQQQLDLSKFEKVDFIVKLGNSLRM